MLCFVYTRETSNFFLFFCESPLDVLIGCVLIKNRECLKGQSRVRNRHNINLYQEWPLYVAKAI